MRIQPSDKDFKNWKHCVPTEGDLLFLNASLAKDISRLPFPLYARDEIREQNLTLWTLSMRSWYGYALNKADFCMWVPCGFLEKLDHSFVAKLARNQIHLGVPTLISVSYRPQEFILNGFKKTETMVNNSWRIPL